MISYMPESITKHNTNFKNYLKKHLNSFVKLIKLAYQLIIHINKLIKDMCQKIKSIINNMDLIKKYRTIKFLINNECSK